MDHASQPAAYSSRLESDFAEDDRLLLQTDSLTAWVEEALVPTGVQVEGKVFAESGVVDLDVTFVYSQREEGRARHSLRNTGVRIDIGRYTGKILRVELSCASSANLLGTLVNALKRLDVEYVNERVPLAVRRNVLMSKTLLVHVVTDFGKFAESTVLEAAGDSQDETA